MKCRNHNSPQSQGIPNTSICIMEWNIMYKSWISYALMSEVVCVLVSIQIRKKKRMSAVDQVPHHGLTKDASQSCYKIMWPKGC
jgi:hypothetical protein